MAFTTATGLSRYTDVPWPRGLATITGSDEEHIHARQRSISTATRQLLRIFCAMEA